ncbi:IS3 family transposase, partial [Streptococcus pyogenes]
GLETTYQSLDKLEEAITDYIFYYNNKRIKAKLNPFNNYLSNFLGSVHS